jgi:hypothetical protein
MRRRAWSWTGVFRDTISRGGGWSWPSAAALLELEQERLVAVRPKDGVGDAFGRFGAPGHEDRLPAIARLARAAALRTKAPPPPARQSAVDSWSSPRPMSEDD